MTANPTSAVSPSVGIFWFVPEGAASRLLHDLTPLDKAEPYGDMLTHDRGHAQFWDHLSRLGAARLRGAGIPLIPLSAEYDEYPRGRVVYDKRRAQFIVYADRRLRSAGFRHSVEHMFGLDHQRVSWLSDAHYARSRAIPALGSSER